MSDFNPPVLIIGFRRANEIEQVIGCLECYKPNRVYLAMDGPRSQQERVLTDAARASALKSIHWECTLKTHFMDENVGCAQFVTHAISWFFDHEYEGLILEDDILIHPDLIKFIRAYHNYDAFSCLCSCTFESLLSTSSQGFIKRPFCSWIPSIWGWYSSREVWREFTLYQRSKNPAYNFKILRLRIGFWQSLLFAMCLDYIDRSKMNAWDYEFAIFMISSGRVSLFPPVQLSSNIGNSSLATNCSLDSQLTNALRDDVNFSCIQPEFISMNYYYMKHQSMNTLMKNSYKIQALKHFVKLLLESTLLKFKHICKQSKPG
jgi:GR25 family glycosyltransferase involved in LPS biosynthesis